MAMYIRTLDEWDCIDMRCGHFDGDECTLGACLDPPTPYDTAYEYWLEKGDYLGDIQREEE